MLRRLREAERNFKRASPRLLKSTSTSIEAPLRPLLLRALATTTGDDGAYPTARPVIHGLPGSKLTYFPSRSQGGHMICFGHAIAARCLFLESDAATKRYRTNPMILPLQEYRYLPSIVRIDADQKLHVEEIRYSRTLTDNVREDCRLLEAAFAKEDISFRLFKDTEIHSTVDHHNLDFLYRGRFAPMPPGGSDLVMSYLADHDGRASLNRLYVHLRKHCIRPVFVLNMVWEGVLHYDHAERLHSHSTIWLPNERA